MKDFSNMYKRIISWNNRAGVKEHAFGTLNWDSATLLQCKLLVEEASETLEGIEYGNMVELLDGTVDSFVILAKLIDILEKAGFDFIGACEAVMDNNDLKIYDSYYTAVEAKEKLEERDDQEYSIETAICNGMPFYSVRRFDGKIMKKVGFVPVSLDEFVP